MSDSWRPRPSHTERTARAVQSMIPGTMEGRIAQAAPTTDRLRQEQGSGSVIEVPFSYYGVPDPNEESPPYFNRSPLADMGTVIISTVSSPSTSLTVYIRVNESNVAMIVLPSGNNTYAELLVDDVVLSYGDKITCVTGSSIPSGLENFTVQILLEEAN